MAGLGGAQDFDLGDVPPSPFQERDVTTTAVGLPSIPAGATKALVAVEGADVRWKAGGVNPTTSSGMPLWDGTTTPFLHGADALEGVRLIAVSGTAKVSVVYFK